MSAQLPEIAHQMDDQAAQDRAIDRFLESLSRRPEVLALGEPTHGVPVFPTLRNEVLRHLVDRGFRSVALETDHLRARLVNDYVTGGPGDLDGVLRHGFSHDFGAIGANRDLVKWLRAVNADRPVSDRIRFHGFDGPMEIAAAPSPRHHLEAALRAIPVAQRPASARSLNDLLGSDDDWTAPQAMYDPAASVGDDERARRLRVVADDLVTALRRTVPQDTGATAHARTAVGLLRYHQAMATASPTRMGTLLTRRAEMMAANLLAVAATERDRGPCLVFAHNVHLVRGTSAMAMGDGEARWAGAGAIASAELGDRYAVIVTDASPDPEPGTLQARWAATTRRRALIPAQRAQDPLPAGAPMVPGHLPLGPSAVAGADAVVFLRDTDGRRIDYW